MARHPLRHRSAQVYHGWRFFQFPFLGQRAGCGPECQPAQWPARLEHTGRKVWRGAIVQPAIVGSRRAQYGPKPERGIARIRLHPSPTHRSHGANQWCRHRDRQPMLDPLPEYDQLQRAGHFLPAHFLDRAGTGRPLAGGLVPGHQTFQSEHRLWDRACHFTGTHFGRRCRESLCEDCQTAVPRQRAGAIHDP